MLERRESADGVVYYVSPLLERLGVVHAFSTRVGGVSPPPFDSLNLGNPSDTELRDEWDRIHENYRRLQQAIGWSGEQRVWVHQVHGGQVAQLHCGEMFRSGVKADALIGDDPQRLLAVRVADCVPVLMCNEYGTTVAAVHAGWRGVVAQVVPNGVAALAARSQTLPHGLLAAIGPCIGKMAFEVGPEVLDEFERIFGPDAPVKRNPDGKGRVNLREAVRMQLVRCGVPLARIDMTDRCTHRDADEFFSHRRERGVTGRMAAVIAPRE